MSVKQAQGPELMSPNVTGFGIAYSVAVIFNALLMMLKESYPAVHNLMAVVGHHWVTHGVLDLLVFLILGYIIAARGVQWDGGKLAGWVAGSTILAGLLIVGFFVIVG